jgi:hypothetical protein
MVAYVALVLPRSYPVGGSRRDVCALAVFRRYAWPEPQPTTGRHTLPPGTPPGPVNWPPDPQPMFGMHPWPPLRSPQPQLPLLSQPPPPGSSLTTTCVVAGVVVAGPAIASSDAAGAAAIAAAATPATTSGFTRLCNCVSPPRQRRCGPRAGHELHRLAQLVAARAEPLQG